MASIRFAIGVMLAVLPLLGISGNVQAKGELFCNLDNCGCEDDATGPFFGRIDLSCDIQCFPTGVAYAAFSSELGTLSYDGTGCNGPSFGAGTAPGPNAEEVTFPTSGGAGTCTGGTLGFVIGFASLFCYTQASISPGAIAPTGTVYTPSQVMTLNELHAGDAVCQVPGNCILLHGPSKAAFWLDGAFAWFNCDQTLCERGGGHPSS